jgi:hypothetical protein
VARISFLNGVHTQGPDTQGYFFKRGNVHRDSFITLFGKMKPGCSIPAFPWKTSFARECVKEVLIRQLKNLALTIYLCMSKKKRWGAVGEDRTAASFCRSIMRIPCDRVIIPTDIMRFQYIVGTCDAKTGKKSGPFCTEFIFGEVTWTEIAGAPIYIFQDEYTRPPMHHLPIAGRAGAFAC